jgi:hypothetical protein
MKYAVIYAENLARPRFLDVDSESLDALKAMDMSERLNPTSVNVFGIVDYEGQKTVSAMINHEGRLIEVPDGDYGIATTAEFFEGQSV